MKSLKLYARTLCLCFSFFFFLPLTCFAVDTDIYMDTVEGVKPNIVIVIDNSTSMLSEIDTGADYDPAITYPADPGHPTINKDYVYENNGDWFSPLKTFKTSIALVDCSTARNKLSSKGIYIGNTSSDCSKKSNTLATGNWLNFYLSYDEMVGRLPRIDVAKKVITDILETINGVRVGIMVFNKGSCVGGRVLTYIQDIDEHHNRQDLIDDINAIIPETGTPLAQTLYEAGLYFKGAISAYNPHRPGTLDYAGHNPIQYSCQKNFVIYLTDGGSHLDDDDILRTVIGDQDGDQREPPGAPNDPRPEDPSGTDFMDDVAKYLYDHDLSSTLEGIQNVTTYTISFRIQDGIANDLLRRTALHGHGKYYTAQNAAELAYSFSNVFSEVLTRSSSYVAPVVPVSRMEKATAGDKLYLAFFKPKLSSMWTGNIKKYGVQQTNDAANGLVVGDILDVSGTKAMDSNGEFYSATTSYWTTGGTDGGEVERGGVGEVLRDRTSARKLYTYFGTNSTLTDASNAFSKTNSSITTTLLNVSTTDDKNKLIDFIHGTDVWDDNRNGVTTDKRDWLLGSFLHSKPYVLHYADRTVIYAGSNDGMLHAFNDETGEELWAFIPPEFLGRLIELHSLTPGIFVDGSPKAYTSYNGSGTMTQALLIFGMRRGGNKYYALDVTDPLTPHYAWKIDPDTMSDYAEMGQSWSTPVIGKVAIGTGDKWVAIIGGGYDVGQDDGGGNAPPDDHGRAVYVVDVLTGALVKRFSFAENSAMTYSIPSDITSLDMDGDGRVERLYVGDMNAQVWRFDIGASDTSSWTGRILFRSNRDHQEKRKIFYPPDVTFETGSAGDYEMLYFGTGDRENPKGERDTDRIYAVKDRSSMTMLHESNLVDVTQDELQDPRKNQATRDQILSDLNTLNGWFIILEKRTGEKCLSSPVVYGKVAYYTTFAPTLGRHEEIDPCLIGEGIAKLYALGYQDGTAVFNLDDDIEGTIGENDRSIIIGSSIPSGVSITIIGGKVVAYVGVGGGVYTPDLTTTKNLFPVYWDHIF